MKIRIFSPHFPFPPTEGVYLTIYEQAKRYAEQGNEVELIYWKDTLEVADRKRMQPYFKPFHPGIRTVCWAGVEPGARWTRVAKSLLSNLASPELHYFPEELDRRSELPATDLEIYHYSFAYSWLRRGRSPSRTAVYFHNLESDLFELRKASSPIAARWVQHVNARKLRAHESRLGSMADEVWFVSPADLETYRALGPRAELKFVPPTFDPDIGPYRQKLRRKFLEQNPESTSTILGFIGALDFRPNQDSLNWVIEQVLPGLAEAGFSGELRIAGKKPPEWLKRKASIYPWVKWLGFVPDIDQFWAEISVLLAPHITGSGTRMKILEAIASETPVMTNSRATDLMSEDAKSSHYLLVRDHSKDWVKTLSVMFSRQGPDR